MISVIVLTLACFSARASAQLDAKGLEALYKRVVPSLVVMQYTYDGELGRREFSTTGVVVSDDGVVMVSGSITPSALPDEQMTDFKIVIPGDEETEIKATFLGRDERTGMSLMKAAEPHEWVALKFEDTPLSVGEPVYSVGLMPKDAGYKAYLMSATIGSLLRGPVPQVFVTGGGLGGIGAPVISADGKAIGAVHAQRGSSPLLNEPRDSMAYVLDPPKLFVPAKDFMISISDPPKSGEGLKIPHIGVSQMSGLKKEVAEYYGLKGQPAVQVGDVIPNFPADKGGLKSGDIIVKMNGEPLERGDEPDETPMIMSRKLQRMKIGDAVTFTVLTAKDAPQKEVKLTLEERPKQASTAKRFFADDLGFTSREVVFEDTYLRKLPPDTKGVVVALIKPNSSAQTGKLQNGDLITRLNQTQIESLDQFKAQYSAFRKDRPRDAVVLEVLRGVNTEVVRIEPPQ
jgi:serine protease Do